MCQCNDALLHEDLITPVHTHDGRDEFIATLPGEDPRTVSLQRAGEIVGALRPQVELTDVEHAADGPRGVRRRHLLAGVGAGLGSLVAPSPFARFAFAADVPGAVNPRVETADLLVVIFLRGGQDGLSLLPPDDAAYRAVRPTIAVPDELTLPLSGNIRLNSNAAALQDMWAANELAFVLGSGNGPGTRSHFDEMAAIERSAPVSVRSGWLGRHLSTSSASQGTFRAVSWGGSSVLSLATTFSTLAMSSIQTFDVAATPASARSRVLSMIDQMYGAAGGAAGETANSVLDAINGLTDLRSTVYVPENGAQYPASPFGQGLRDTAAMVKAGKGLEVACVDIGDWDMHQGLGKASDPAGWFSYQARNLAEGLAAFRTDLGSRWATTTVVTMTEFGRRVQENGSGGLDHGKGSTMMVAGGAVNGGIYGSQPSLDLANLNAGDLPITVDYRQVLAEIIDLRLGNGANLDTVLPGYTYTGPLGLVRA